MPTKLREVFPRASAQFAKLDHELHQAVRAPVETLKRLDRAVTPQTVTREIDRILAGARRGAPRRKKKR